MLPTGMHIGPANPLPSTSPGPHTIGTRTYPPDGFTTMPMGVLGFDNSKYAAIAPPSSNSIVPAFMIRLQCTAQSFGTCVVWYAMIP